MTEKGKQVDAAAVAVANQIDQITTTITRLGKDQTKIEQALNIVQNLIIVHHLGIIIAMYHNGSLLTLLQQTCQLYKQLINKNKESVNAKELLETLNIIVDVAMDCLFVNQLQYTKILKGFKAKLKDMKKYKEFLNPASIEIYQFYRKKLKQFMEIRYNQKWQAYQKIQNLSQFINQLHLPVPKTCYEQITSNWLKKQISSLQQAIYKQKPIPNVGFCCSLHFQHSQYNLHNLQFTNHYYITTTETKFLELKHPQYKEHLDNIKKTASYYLNNDGGFIILGIQQKNKNKQGIIQGIPMTKAQRLVYLKALSREVITKIFPMDGEDIEDNEKQEQVKIDNFIVSNDNRFNKQVETSLQHQLSKFISIQFLNVYNKLNLLNSRRNGVQLYVLRIKIKMGNPAELYFILNSKEIPEAFTEQSKALTLVDYYNKVYEKLKNEANGKLQIKDKPIHLCCRHLLKYQLTRTKEPHQI